MRLDRNSNDDKHGKYALLKLRRLNDFREQGAFGELAHKIAEAIKVLEDAGAIDWGTAETESEFFVMKLKDKFSLPALREYAQAARPVDAEYADDIDKLADRAGHYSPWCKLPD